MTEPVPPEKGAPSRDWLPSWSKISEFLLNVMQLERSFESLRAQNVKLRDQVTALQRQVDEQNGPLKAAMGFIQVSLREQVETSAEKAAARLFERLIAFKADPLDSSR